MFGETAFGSCGETMKDKTNRQISILFGKMSNSHVSEVPCLLGLLRRNLSAEGGAMLSGKMLCNTMAFFPIESLIKAPRTKSVNPW